MCHPSIVELILLGSTVPGDYDTRINFTIIANLLLLGQAVVSVYDNESLIFITYTSWELGDILYPDLYN